MTTNEIITICIASAALLVSLVTMYFTHFHKKLGLIGCLAAYNTESDSNPLYGNYEFSLSNTGNRELLVWEAQLDLVGAIGQYTVPEVPSSELPTVIKPGQILLLSFGIPVLFMRNAAKSGYKVLVRFHGFSPEAKSFFLYKELKPLNEELEIDAKGWEPFIEVQQSWFTHKPCNSGTCGSTL
jgi:hypothetical protein